MTDADSSAGSKAGTVSFQVLDSTTVMQKRSVFFIRHGESTWNAAQSQGNLAEMARTTDHSLSVTGSAQAESLCERIEKARRQHNTDALDLAGADAFYVSPLTRAIQTAVVTLGPTMLEAEEHGEFILMGTAREKQNLGGFDSMSTKTGVDILRHAHKEMAVIYEGRPNRVTQMSRVFNGLHFDVQEVQEEWWCISQSDSKEELEGRLNDFMSQLLYTPHRTVVVVGHSHFFRAVLQNFLSKDLPPDVYQNFTKNKIDNCGVLRLELDPSRDLEQHPIVSVDLVLGSKMLKEGGGMLKACCTAEAPGIGEIDVTSDDAFDIRRPDPDDSLHLRRPDPL